MRRIDRREAARLGVGAVGMALGTPARGAEPVFQTTELNHVALRVTDLDRSERFYHEVLGLETLRRLDTVRFMRCGPHFVALFQGSAPGLDHLALSWPPYDQEVAAARLRAAGLEFEHEETRTYLYDPDGLQIQVAWNEDWPGREPRPDPCADSSER